MEHKRKYTLCFYANQPVDAAKSSTSTDFLNFCHVNLVPK